MSDTFVLIGGACDGMRVTLPNQPELFKVRDPRALYTFETLSYRRHCVHSLGGDGGHDQITFYAMEGMTIGTALKYLLTAYPRPKEDPAT